MTDIKLNQSQSREFKNTFCLNVEDIDGNLYRMINTDQLHLPSGTSEVLKRVGSVVTFLEGVIAKKGGKAAAAPKSVPEPTLPFSCPESILFIHPEATRLSVDVDMVKAIVNRTLAMIEVLDGYYQTPVEHRPGYLNDYTVSDYLWQLTGNLRLIEQIVDTSSSRNTTTPNSH